MKSNFIIEKHGKEKFYDYIVCPECYEQVGNIRVRSCEGLKHGLFINYDTIYERCTCEKCGCIFRTKARKIGINSVNKARIATIIFLIGVIIAMAFTPSPPFDAVLAILTVICGTIALTAGFHSIL